METLRSTRTASDASAGERQKDSAPLGVVCADGLPILDVCGIREVEVGFSKDARIGFRERGTGPSAIVGSEGWEPHTEGCVLAIRTWRSARR